MIRPFQLGDKVTYIEHKDSPLSDYKKGIVKWTPNSESVFVVFECKGDWECYFNYPSICVPIGDVHMGWIEDGTFKPPKKIKVVEESDNEITND